ncbi:hypothetical protein Tco_1241350 [Tanacetum coccineum]
MENNVYLVKQCACKDVPIRSPTGIGVGLEEHLASMEHTDKILNVDRSEFGAWFADRLREDISPLLKCTSAIRQLAYAIVPKFLDEYMQMSDRTSRLTLYHFCKSVMENFGPGYSKKPTVTDVVKLYQHHEEKHGFSGM